MKTSEERTKSIIRKAEMQRNKRRKIKNISIASGVAAALLAFNLVLFVPYTVGDADISKYSSSEYYGVIQKLYGLTYSPHKTNNFTEWFDGMFSYGAAAPDTAPTAPENGNGYRETTLNQTDGVTEGDLFKRSDTHIFYLGFTGDNHDVPLDDDATLMRGSATYELCVYTIAGEKSEQTAEYTVLPDDGIIFSGYQREMYLSEDLSTVTVISQCYDHSAALRYAAVISLDVSDLSDIKENGRTYISGSYVSSRVTDGGMLVITDFAVRYNVDFDAPSQYLPQVGKMGGLKPLLADDIVCPSNADAPRYTVICTLDDKLEPMDSVALLSYSDDVYVSGNNLFATRQYEKRVKTDNEYKLNYSYYESEIRIVPYNNGELGKTRSVTAAGSVLNRYSLDEYDGMLRAVTTVSFIENGYVLDKNVDDPYKGVFRNRCMLYCYDLDTLEIKAKVTDFAPVGESVRSARFYGDTAYVCTAEVDYMKITDPVFAFDLSDINNVTYRDTGTIPGYSLSLNGFAFDTLLGIGYGDDISTLKIELYEQTDGTVASVAKHEEYGVRFSTEFKAHLIDADNGIIGMGIQSRFGGKTRYAIFRYNGCDLTEIGSVETEGDYLDGMRAVAVDGYVYIFEDDGYTAQGLKVMKIA